MNVRRVLRFVAAGAIVVAVSSPAAATASARTAGATTCSLTVTLQEGSKGPDVRCLESRLIALGAAGVVGPDDSFGPSTSLAVFTFQAEHGLLIDGVVGPRTRAALAVAQPESRATPIAPKIRETRVIGTSVQGRPITAVRMGTPGGRVVLVIGVIHGDEAKGALITQALRAMPTPADIDLWLIDSINPDGVANGTRGNANGVDLNRNFESGWNYIPRSTTNRQYSGEAPADQPETQAVEAFVVQIRPSVAIWYHQDANVVSVNGSRRAIPTLYAKLVGLGTGSVPCTALCTGTAGTFVNSTISGATSFLVELPGSAVVTRSMIRRHAVAVLAVIGL